MCEKIPFVDIHLASMTGMVDIICADLPYDDLNPNVC